MGNSDIRLYYYDSGTLRKWGRLKTPGNSQHYFNNLDECRDYVNKWTSPGSIFHKRFKDTAFVVVEYLDTYTSRILAVIHRGNCSYIHYS